MRKLILTVIITLLALPVWAQTPVVIRDGTTGAEKGTSAAPLRTDPTGSTTQPVSGTVQPGNTANTTPWLFQIRDAAGNARGANVTAGNALVIDGSAATQPVSGTVAVSNSFLLDATFTGRMPAGASPATGETNTNTALSRIGGYNFIFNGTTWDRWTGAVTLAANQSVNVAQVAGTTTDTNSGTKSAGTIRVVIATDQPALTNKLLVTPDSVALPANQSVNVAQVNGVATTTGAGATGTGVQRVNDVSSSATGAAPPASGSYIVGLGSGATGGFLVGVPVCDTFKAVSVTSATTTLMVTGVAGRQVRICSVNLVTAIANNVVLISGTGATCGTGTGAIAGGTTAANGWNFAANGGLSVGSGFGTVMQTAVAGDSVCVITSAAGPLAGTIAYTIY
jgi:hypothetical protein